MPSLSPCLLGDDHHERPPLVGVTAPVEHQARNRRYLQTFLGNPDMTGVSRGRPLLVSMPLPTEILETYVQCSRSDEATEPGSTIQSAARPALPPCTKGRGLLAPEPRQLELDDGNHGGVARDADQPH